MLTSTSFCRLEHAGDGRPHLLKGCEEPRALQPIVVMCTTENDLARIVEAMQAGANEYIMKPFTEDIVREKLHETGVL
jgi:two-component system chemotaxis response regulator CheY